MSTQQGRQKRVLKELENIRVDPPENCSAGLIDDANLYKWRATIMGPVDTPFYGGIFSLTLELTERYPFEPPIVKFETPVYHPNIKDDGGVCLEILTNKDKWSPTMSISKVLSSISSLLTNPDTGHSLRPDVAKEYDQNREKYLKTAREWTEKYAM